ncbi:MAG: DegQ family serine endoprotease [Candidatus Rokubacteria bacterium]|nr:DegQ family serine endoprotease [Candidatus Rokubacteria bacterium]
MGAVLTRWSVLLLVGLLLLACPPDVGAQQSQDPKATLRAMEDAFVAVVEHVMPAVVNVSTTPKKEAASEEPQTEERFREFFGPEFFERFFRGRPPREPARSSGSGVIVDPRGYILTNNHVIENAADIQVRLSDQRKFPATLVGRDPKTDLAVLKIEAPGPLPVAELGDSDRLKIGQWAIAIGNPFGLDRTVTLGIVSATGRMRLGVSQFENFIQTDASINPGNSGGPLLNLDGKVVGINTAIVATGQGIGFSIPINMAKEVMAQLINQGRVVRGWLGIVIQDLSDELAGGFGVAPRSGVLVADVMKDSPAEAAGLRAGDVIVEFGGRATPEVPELQRRVAATPPGQPIPLTILREKKPERLTVKLGEMPGEETVVAAAPTREAWGLRVAMLTPELAQRYDLTAREGVVVMEVAPGGPADRAGIRQGDAILEVNRRPVRTLEAFQQALAKVKAGEGVAVYLQRGGGRHEYVVLKGPESK